MRKIVRVDVCLYVCLLLFHAKTAGLILMKLPTGSEIPRAKPRGAASYLIIKSTELAGVDSF